MSPCVESDLPSLLLTAMILAAVTRRLFWFLLVDQKNGESYRGTTVSSVSLEPTNVIDEFRDAVKAKNDDDLLKGISSSKLLVYNNKAAFEARNDKRGKANWKGINFFWDSSLRNGSCCRS